MILEDKDIAWLKVYIDQRFADNKEAVAAALQSVKEAKAIELAALKEAMLKKEAADNARFEAGNNIKEALESVLDNMMPRKESESRHEETNRRLKTLEDASLRRASETGGQKNLWVLLVGGVMLLIAVITFLMKMK